MSMCVQWQLAVTSGCSQDPGLPGTLKSTETWSWVPSVLLGSLGAIFPKATVPNTTSASLKVWTHGGDPKRQVLWVSLRGPGGPETSLPTTMGLCSQFQPPGERRLSQNYSHLVLGSAVCVWEGRQARERFKKGRKALLQGVR